MDNTQTKSFFNYAQCSITNLSVLYYLITHQKMVQKNLLYIFCLIGNQNTSQRFDENVTPYRLTKKSQKRQAKENSVPYFKIHSELETLIKVKNLYLPLRKRSENFLTSKTKGMFFLNIQGVFFFLYRIYHLSP